MKRRVEWIRKSGVNSKEEWSELWKVEWFEKKSGDCGVSKSGRALAYEKWSDMKSRVEWIRKSGVIWKEEWSELGKVEWIEKKSGVNYEKWSASEVGVFWESWSGCGGIQVPTCMPPYISHGSRSISQPLHQVLVWYIIRFVCKIGDLKSNSTNIATNQNRD